MCEYTMLGASYADPAEFADDESIYIEGEYYDSVDDANDNGWFKCIECGEWFNIDEYEGNHGDGSDCIGVENE